MNRDAWHATVHGVVNSWLSNWTEPNILLRYQLWSLKKLQLLWGVFSAHQREIHHWEVQKNVDSLQEKLERQGNVCVCGWNPVLSSPCLASIPISSYASPRVPLDGWIHLLAVDLEVTFCLGTIPLRAYPHLKTNLIVNSALYHLPHKTLEFGDRVAKWPTTQTWVRIPVLPLPPCMTLEPITWSFKVWVVSWVKRGKLCNPMTLSLFSLCIMPSLQLFFFISSNSVGFFLTTPLPNKLKSLLMKVKEESEKVGLKLN